MLQKRNLAFHAAGNALGLLFMLIVCAAMLCAQTRQIVAWQEDLNFLENASDEELMANRAAVIQIRRGIELWARLHPSTKISLEPAPAEPWGAAEIRSQVASLRSAASAELTSRYFSRNVFGASFVFRDDTHKEIVTYPAQSPFPFVTPTLLDRQQTFSMGFQDVITISTRLRATIGFSADHLRGLQAQQRINDDRDLVPFTCASEPDNSSFSGCTAHVWSYNPQASLPFSATNLDTFYVTFADRSRFPLLKDSNSGRLGQALPNPELKPEKNTSWNIGYSHAFPAKTVGQIEYFHNHLRHAIEGVYVVDPGSFCFDTGAQEGYCSQNVNIGKEIHQGFEVSVRSTPVSRLTLDASYSYLNRTINYDFGSVHDVSEELTSVLILPTVPQNKFVINANLRLPRQILAIANVRYEGGITLQDTTYRSGPESLPYGSSYATMDLGTLVPIYAGFSAQAGIKNLFDRNYYYTAGYPEPGRN